MTDFGGKLRQARERRGISLRQLAASTKISVAVLEALERNDISKLPGGIFSRAFVRSYAADVGLDPDETVREFLGLFELRQAEEATERQPPSSDEESAFESEQRMAGVVLKLVVVAVPLIGVILYFSLRSKTAPPPPESPAVPAVTTPGTSSSAAPLPSRASGPPATQPATLELHPTGACWVSVTIEGRPAFAKLMQAGDRERIVVKDEAVVEVGDAGAFAYSINGNEQPPIGAAGQVKTVRVSAAAGSR